ncbi:MAG: phosphatase PAP2 family protein [Melioribacteraceae bacterium]|nr:phosphatase PAP2 family protein [Melioribacteraceae bacterium]
MNIKLSIIAVLLFLPTLILPQNKYDFKQAANETKEFFRIPSNWESKDFILAASLSAVSYGLMHFDADVKNFGQENNQYSESIIAEFGRIWGEPYFTFGIGIISIITGNSNGNVANKQLGFEILQSSLYSVLVTQTIKMSIGRARPYMNEGAFSFSPFQLINNDRWSFPSGHTTLAFSLSTVLAANEKNDLLKIVYFIPAVLTGASRIYQNHHWLSDVFMGAAIGYFCGSWINDLHAETELVNPTPPIPILNFTFQF